jgi:Flp pilus assembly protein TadD
MRHSAEKPAQVAKQLFQTAITLHQDGALQRAEHLYREVLRQFPQHAGALNMLGVIGCQTGNFKQGADLIRQAIELDPDNPDYHNNLGMASMQNGASAKRGLSVTACSNDGMATRSTISAIC